MSYEDITPEIREFVARYVSSVGDLEALLLLHGRGPEGLTAEQVAERLYTNVDSEARRLAELAAKGLLAANGGRFTFSPVNPAHEGLMRHLEALYRTRRVSMISLIYSKPLKNVRDFSDAFRLWGKEEE